MNQKLIKSYLQRYKDKFENIHNEEIYKWQAVKHFQGHWDIDNPDFPAMLEKALGRVHNLLDSGNYFPKKMLLMNAVQNPQKVRELFLFMYDEEKDLSERVDYFMTEFNRMHKKQFPDKKNHYQDHRAVVVYLALRYPEKYYLYKFSLFKDFADRIDYEYIPTMGQLENIGQYQAMCELVNYEIQNDQELLKLHLGRIGKDCYFDKTYKLLTQDFIFAVVNTLPLNNEVKIPQKNEFENVLPQNSLSFNNEFYSSDLTANSINHDENNRDKKNIGDLGELWVIRYERERLIKAGKKAYAQNIKHISKEKGDGAGYDILSYEEDGSERFIEVKTSTGSFNQPLYITGTELQKSIQDRERFYLYRVYNYNKKTEKASLVIIRGELTLICNFPILYRASLKSKTE